MNCLRNTNTQHENWNKRFPYFLSKHVIVVLSEVLNYSTLFNPYFLQWFRFRSSQASSINSEQVQIFILYTVDPI